MRDKKYFLFLHEILIGKTVHKNIEKKAELQQKQIVLSFSIRDKMKDGTVFTTVESLQSRLISSGISTETTFVPTMGALHEGHLELVRKAMELTELVVVSIFVNPTQFNSQADLENYPRTLENDLKLLESVGNVIVFAPTVNEMYPPGFEEINIELGNLATVMEGKFRPGHFNGVVNVVYRLFEIVSPKYALFGEKDFQQLAIIRRMVTVMRMPVQIVPCQTVRETNGLAKSSRNQRLSKVQKKQALIIIDTLNYSIKNKELLLPRELTSLAIDYFNQGDLELEYLEIVDEKTLQPIDTWDVGSRMCIAAYCGDVRLIDNMEIS